MTCSGVFRGFVMVSKDDLRRVLLDCAEFFRNELDFHTCELMSPQMGARLEAKFTELRDRCYDVLGNPTVADVARIREGGG